MRFSICFISILFFTSPLFGNQDAKSLNLLGSWQYVAFLYQDQIHPLPDSNLVLIFSFSSNGSESISWTRKGSPGFCQATAVYQVDGDNLDSKIISTNPQNNDDCSNDPDMQVGKESVTPAEIRNGQLFLNIGLSGEDFYYIFNPINQSQNLSTERNL